MANNHGTLINSRLVHSLGDALRENLAPLLGLAINFGDQQADGRVIRTSAPGTTITIKDWTAPFTPYTVGGGGYIAPDYAAKADKTVTLPSAVTAVSMMLTAAEYRVLLGADGGAAYNELLAKANRMMVFGLAKKMVTDFFATITAGNFANKTVNAVGAFTFGTEIDIDTALFTRNLMSRENATLILNPTAFGEWAKAHTAILQATGQKQSSLVMSGLKPSSVTNFSIGRTNVTLPVASPRGIGFTQTSHLFVARIPDEPTYEKDPVQLAEVVASADDAGTPGISFLSRVWKNSGTGTMQWDMAVIYSFEPFQGEALQRIDVA